MENPTLITKKRRRRGFTLAEGLMASTVLAASVVGIVAPLSASNSQGNVLQQTTIAAELGQQLMEEITSKPVLDPTDGSATLAPAQNETSRALFDNVGDYHNYSDSTAGLTTRSGTAVSLPGAGTFTRNVKVEYRTSPSGSAVSSGDFVLVSVTVTAPGGDQVVINQMMTKAPVSQ